MSDPIVAPLAEANLSGLSTTGDMGRRTRAFDWSKTPLGPIDSWPQSLKIALRIMLDSRYAMWLGWGPEFTFFYNDAYAAETLGPKHPWALGRPASEVWAEIWDEIGPRAEAVVRTGAATWDEGLRLFLLRNGFLEETYHTFSYSPIPDEFGGIGGMLCVVTEDTERTIGERRLRTLRELATRTTSAVRSVEDACRRAAHTLAENPDDLPFLLIYLLDPKQQAASLAASTGLAPGFPAAPTKIQISDPASDAAWQFSAVMQKGQAAVVSDLASRFGRLRCGKWPESPQAAVVLPLAKPGLAQLAGFVVAGISPRLPFDDSYKGFLDLLAGHITAAIANARAYEEERHRAESLAELDRAKTAFFSNVSHEFRTPLTLLLGPLEDLLGSSNDLPSQVRETLELANRNGLRLLRLVNTLLDFSRIEAGRSNAVFQPTDLAALTGELASVFRSACDRAGLELKVECESFGELVFVDREMWEKIVLNLLSNAFKFTLQGRIGVALRKVGANAELRVSDTGIGIPAEEMPRLFERFHRIENSRGRTHEGSGIGLALVQELARLHGGNVRAESEVGRGTTFIVSIPLGSAHHAPMQLGERRAPSAATIAMPYLEEALRWLPERDGDGRSASADDALLAGANSAFIVSPDGQRSSPDRPRVLVADDNADMRQYLARLLAEQYEVRVAADGEMALAAAREQPPDLILTDVMMPRLDGVGLLRALRADRRLRAAPVIMLSARAGEESRIQGMSSGADDYLVKPFSARELLARVAAHLQTARIRREANDSLRQSEERLQIALGAARMVAWEFIPSTRELALSANVADLLGMPISTIDEAMALLHPDDFKRREEIVEDAFHKLGSYVYRYRILRPDDGRLAWVEERGHAVAASADKPARLVGIVMDITDRKGAEDALREADRRKDEFLAILAHELRNPLVPILNGLEIMRLLPNDPESGEQARVVMERQVGQMVRLIDDLLDLSRISRGKIELRKELIALASAIHQAIETSRPNIEQSGHSFAADIPKDPLFVDADLTRLSQVFSNLLNNAAKYTPPGGCISLAVEQRGNEALVAVRDNGIGIPPQMLGKVFDMFTQVDRTLERTQGGLGIGLSLVRGLVEMHGGNVEARSDGDGKGSEFVVRIPLVQSNVPKDTPANAGDGGGPRRRILVADDNKDAANSLAMVLKIMGHETRTAHDGQEAFETAAAFQPELILLDIGMPRLNGYDACRRIREQPWGKRIVCVALTGWGQEDDKRQSHDAGFDFHFTKPVSPAALEQLLADLGARA